MVPGVALGDALLLRDVGVGVAGALTSMGARPMPPAKRWPSGSSGDSGAAGVDVARELDRCLEARAIPDHEAPLDSPDQALDQLQPQALLQDGRSIYGGAGPLVPHPQPIDAIHMVEADLDRTLPDASEPVLDGIAGELVDDEPKWHGAVEIDGR